MSMDVGGAKGGVKSDINVTPLVDVMLVLLIIMMLIAPLLQTPVAVTLPTATNTAEKPDTSEQTVVYIDANSQLYINALPMQEAELISRLTTIKEETPERVVYLKGDKDAPYSSIMKMMDALRGASIDSVALIADMPAGAAAAGGGQ